MNKVTRNRQQSFEELVARSKTVTYRFPEGPCNRIQQLGADETIRDRIAELANRTHPIAHGRTLTLLREFLEAKRQHGTSVERLLYAEMNEGMLVDRMLRCRPLAFVGPGDSWLLRSGETGSGGFDQIGTENECEPLVLEKLISYDEMQLSALLGVSVPTLFINSGDRQNSGRPGTPGSFIESGVYVGLVGTRFERPGLMEWQHMIVTPAQNTHENGYGQVDDDQDPLLGCWARFYGQESGFPLFSDVANTDHHDDRFLRVGSGYLNVNVYKRRLRMSIEPFLFDARERAREDGRRAYVHAVGLGLGVWGVHDKQGQLMCDVYAEVLADHPDLAEWISDIDFSWFPSGCTCGGVLDGDLIEGVQIHFSKRSPADPFDGPDRLLVAMYAWDGNSFPGNEYWWGSLTASGDPAAACCSLTPELQNADINVAVSGSRLTTYPR